MGGGPSSLPVPWRNLDASTVQARGAALVPLQVGGGASGVAPVVALPFLRSHPRWSPRWDLHGACSLWARSRGPSRTLSPLPPYSAALSMGGVRVPLPSSPLSPLSTSLCSTHVAGMTQARRKHRARLQWGGGFPLWGLYTPVVGFLASVPSGPMSPRPPPGSPRFWSLSSRFLPLARWFALFNVFFLRLHRSPPVSPPGTSVCPLPPPHVPSPPPRCPRPFPGWVGERGVGGGGAPSPSVLWGKHFASTAQARGAALVPLQGGGACRVAPIVPLPTLRSHPRCPPRWGLHGACFLQARSCGPSRTLTPLPPHLAALSSGEGGALSAPPFLHPPPLGGRGGGNVLFPSLHACRRHDASTAQARGAAPGPTQGGGHALWLPSSPFYPVVARPVVPPLGLARRVPSTGTVVWSVPHPLTAASPPCRFVLGGGGRCSPPPFLHPPPLGGQGCVCGGGGAHVFFPS